MIFLLLTSVRSSSLMYISLSLLSFSIKLLSLKEFFIYSFKSSSNVLRPLFIVDLSFYSPSFSSSIFFISSDNAFIIYLKLSCFSCSLSKMAWTSASSFYFTIFNSVKLALISLIYSYFLSSMASSFYNLFSIFLLFSMLSSISWSLAVTSLYLMLYYRLFSFISPSSFLAWSNCNFITSSSSFFDFLSYYSLFTFFSCSSFRNNSSSYCFFNSSFCSWDWRILLLISVSSFLFDSTLIWRIYFSFSSYSLAIVYSCT